MKFKYIILVSLILTILTLSAVSASQDDGNLTVAEEAQDSSSIDENLVDDSSEVISSEDTQEINGENDERENVDSYRAYAPSSAVMNTSKEVYMWIKADNPTGNFTFILNNQIVHDAPIEWDDENENYRHSMLLNELDLQVGLNNLTFIYTGDDNYKPISKTLTINAYYFKAYPIPKNIKIYGDDSTYWTVEVGDKTGSVSVLIDDEVYLNDTITNLLRDYGTTEYTFRIWFMDCPYGDHTYNITYTGKYESITYAGECNVDYYFEYSYQSGLTYPEPINFSFNLPKDVTCNLTVVAKDKNYTVYIENGKGRLTYNYTEFEDQTFIVAFENEKYPKRVLNITVPIEAKAKIPSYIEYGMDDAITLIMPANATGNLTLYRYNTKNHTKGEMIATKALVDGKVSFNSDILDMGYNYIAMEYTGDDYNATLYTFHTLIVHTTLICPEKVNNKYTYNISAISSDKAIGNLTIEIYDYEWENVIMTLYNGSAKGTVTVELPYLESGTYVLLATYDDENQPMLITSSQFIDVGSSDHNWTMNVDFPQELGKESVYFGSDGYFRITNIPKDIIGDIILYVDGKAIKTYNASEYIYEDYDTMYFDLSSLSLGNHTWKVRLDYSTYYTAQPVNGTFELVPYVFPKTIKYNQENALYFDLDNSSANAFLNVIIDGEDYKMVQLKEGKAEIMLNNLPLGKHTYELVCTGDVELYYNGTFDVEMAFVDLKEYRIYYYSQINDVKIALPIYANGTVTLTVNDKKYTSNVENGIATFNLSELDEGNYLLIAEYSGDDVNSAQEINFKLTINSYIVDLEYNEDYTKIIISLTLPSNATGNLSIYNSDTSELIKSVPLVDGKAVIKTEEFNFGIYNIIARYDSENGDYEVVQRTSILRYTPPVNITHPYVGENTTVTVDFRNATGNVTVILNEKEYANLTIQDGKISLSIPYSDLKTARYYPSIAFVYHGNDFDPNAFNYGSGPRPYTIHIKYKPASIPKTISSGEVAYATIELPVNAEGYALLKIRGNGINSIYNMTFSKTESISVAIPVLPAGSYGITFDCFDKYYGETYGVTQYVTVLNPEPELNVVAPTDTNVPTLIFNLPEDATGGLVVTVDGKNYGLNLVNGCANITLPDLENGNYDINVVYSGDDNYCDFDKTVNVDVNVSEPIEREDVDGYRAYAPSSAVMNTSKEVYMWIKADNPTGNFTFILNGQIVYDAPIEWDDENENYRHSMLLNELELQPGINSLTFIYTGDDNYNPISKTLTIDAYYFKAYPIPKNIKIYGDDSTYWTAEVGDKTGYVCVLIDDEVYLNDTIANLLRDYGTTEYTFRIWFMDCPYGDHTYNITYTGKYESITYAGECNVDYYFDYDHARNIIYPDPIKLKLNLPNDVTCNLTVVAKDKNYTVFIENGKGELIYNYTEFEDQTFIVTFENEKYPKRVLNITVPIIARVDVPGYTDYDVDDLITLTLPANATGNLTVYKYNRDNGTKGEMIATKALVDGKASFNSNILDMGFNYITIEYTGDDYAIKDMGYYQIVVHPKVTYPEKVNNQYKYNLTALSSDNAIGNLTITLYDYEWEILIMTLYDGPAKGAVTLELPDLASGDYGLFFRYNDENQPISVDSIEYLYVGDSDYNWTMNVDFPQIIVKESINLQNYGYFKITNIPEDIVGKVTLYVDGNKIYKFNPIEEAGYDGELRFSLSSLSHGNHTWELILTDNYYTAQPVNGTFEIIPYYFPATLKYNTGRNYSLYFDLDNSSANAFLNVIIDGEDYKMVQLKEGKAEIMLNNLPLGKHTYELVCTGDVELYYNGTFDVEMGFDDLTDYFVYAYGTLTNVKLGLPDTANGIVTITVNNKTYTSDVENGIATFNLSELDKGSHLLRIKYSGDDINPAQEIEFNLNINRYEVRSDYVSNYSRLIGFSLVLPSNATGNLSIYNGSNSALIKSIPLVDGKAVFKIEDELNFGEYRFIARYDSENGDYEVSPATTSFKYTPIVNVTNIYVGDNGTVNVDFKNATGNVTVILNDNEYANLTIQDGKISLSIPYLDLVSSRGYYYSVAFVYHGDDFDPNIFYYAGRPATYLGFINDNKPVIPKTIHNGEVAYITVELPANSEGYAVLEIKDNGITSIYNMTYSNTDKISMPIPILPAGEYWMDFSYYNAYYDRISRDEQRVSVLNPEPELDIVAPTDTDVPTLIFNLPEDAKGSIVVTVNGKNYGFNLVNGCANKTIPDLENGEYDVSVVYSGDDNYAGFDKTVKVIVDVKQGEPAVIDDNSTVVNQDPKVVADDLTMVYTDGSIYKATIWGADGKLASNVEVTFLINGKVFKTVQTDANGVASVKLTQVPGTYEITSKALGKTVTKKLTVKHLVTLKKVKVKRSAKKLVLKATLRKVNGKYLKNKKITFKFKGKKYTAKTNKKGVAKVTIKSSVLKKLKAGKKVTYQATYLKDTVKKTVKVKK